MAITINVTPPIYGVLNASIWRITSDRPTITQFKVQVQDAITSAVLANQKYAVLPMTPQGTSFNVAPLIASFLDSPIINTSTLIEPAPNVVKGYKLFITEIYTDATGASVIGSTTTSGGVYIINATLSRYDFKSYYYPNYVGGFSGATTKFLNLRPLTSSIFYSSKSYLYFASNSAAIIRLNFYKNGIGLIGTHDIATPASNEKAFRVNVSPIALQAFFGDSLTNLYGQEFSAAFTIQFGTQKSIGDSNYYTVQMVGGNGAGLSELRTYIMKSDNCRQNIVNLLFSNSLGGFDSMTFLEPKQTVTSTKTRIDSNVYQYDASGNYVDNVGGIFNRNETVIASENKSSFSVVSEPMNDQHALFGRALIESDKVYMTMLDGSIYPIVLDPLSYAINKRKYNQNNSRMNLTFSIEDNNFNL